MYFRMVSSEARRRAAAACMSAPEGYVLTIKPPTRSLDQNAKFHALCSDLSKSVEWAGKKRSVDDWKTLLVSGHAIATKQSGEVMQGLEGELIQLRESTASMSKARSASLIDYAQAFASQHLEVA